jgi:hypothetical protein
MDHRLMKIRTALVIGASLPLLASAVLLWRLMVEHQRTTVLIAHIDRRSNDYVDFVVYRAYKDAAADIKSGILSFSSRDGWERSFQIGTLNVVVECVSAPDDARRAGRTNLIDWHSVYNWHKGRAAFRQLQQGTNASAASELLE